MTKEYIIFYKERENKMDNYFNTSKISLVLEGGGMRGFYSAGVLDAFLEHNISFDYVIGVSAGAVTALSYVSKQLYRNKEIMEKYSCDKRYKGRSNLLKNGSFFGTDFILDEIPNKLLPLDWETFQYSNTRFLTGTFDCCTGETVWYEKDEYGEKLEAIKASCAFPFISKIVPYDGRKLLDGGLSQNIPIEKSMEDGNEFHVIVLTRNIGYVKKSKEARLSKVLYKKFPKVIEILENRNDIYNQQLELCEQLEREGKAIILRPTRTLDVNWLEKNKKKIIDLYNDGISDASNKINDIKSLFRQVQVN